MSKNPLPKPTDKRIVKTKKKLESAILKLLEQKPLSDFTVREICKEAGTTTITFYTYYKDKYALASEVFGMMAERAAERFNELQGSNNPDQDLPQICCNLLDSILFVYQEIKTEYSLEIKNPDPYLFVAMSDIIIDKVSDIMGQIEMSESINKHAVSSFFCFGLWGYICDGFNQGLSVENIQKEAKHLIRSVINSD